MPSNDLILWSVEQLGPWLWIPLFVAANYLVVIILMLVNGQSLSRLRRDKVYHFLWVLVLPAVMALLIPKVYGTLSGCTAGATALFGASPARAALLASHSAFRSSSMVSAGTGIVAILLSMWLWPAIFRTSSIDDVDYWWFRRQGVTLPGWFFLLMCAVPVWSVLTFLANAVSDQVLLLRLFLELGVENFDFGSTLKDRLGTLRPFQDFLIAFLSVWAVGNTLASVHASVRRKAGIAKAKLGFDWLSIVNLAVVVTVIALVAFMVLRVHDVLLAEKKHLHEVALASGTTEAWEHFAFFPVWPFDWKLLYGVGPKLASLAISITRVLRAFSWSRKRQ